MSRTTILIVDDHAMVRKGLRLLIESHHDLSVVGEAGSLLDAAEVAARLEPRVITLDLTMPGPAGVSGIQRLLAASPNSRIVVVTMHDDPAYIRSSIAMGAAGYVHKSAADTELINAIRAVARDKIFISAAEHARLPEHATPAPGNKRPDAPAIESLSEREMQVLRQVALGYTNQRIADEVGLSVKTVESYRARLMKKLGLRERADLVRLAIERGLLQQ